MPRFGGVATRASLVVEDDAMVDADRCGFQMDQMLGRGRGLDRDPWVGVGAQSASFRYCGFPV